MIFKGRVFGSCFLITEEIRSYDGIYYSKIVKNIHFNANKKQLKG